MSKIFNAVITEEVGGFVAMNPDTSVASQGDTVQESPALYLEEVESDGGTSEGWRPAFLATVSV